ncbi:MAG: LacI family DNA-binding transcriptional regulator [Rhodobacteraceae bacterium]|nr:LacI family DNA-binding transcriptional regulator [Paracoccaceae bacterium]
MAKDPDIKARSRRVTAQMIADLAGVSRSAVSRAFTKGGYVEAEKRQRIYEVAAEHGYQPNALAASLQGGRSQLVAVVAGDFRNTHDSEFTFKLCTALNKSGLWPLLIASEDEASGITVEDALRFPLDAIVIRGGSMSASLVTRCSKLGIPMICYGRPLGNIEADAVFCQNAAGMRKIVDVLLARGRRNFGFVAGPPGYHSSDERRKGLLDALADAGLALRSEHQGDFNVNDGYAATLRMMDECTDIDAIVCANDASAVGALGALQSLGKNVPNDVSVTGFDDAEMARWPMFSLTTVSNPISPTVEAVVRLIERRLSDLGASSQTLEIVPEVQLRQTH